MEKRVLILDTIHPVLKEKLEKAGYFVREAFRMSRESLLEEIQAVHGIVLRSRVTIDRELLDRADNLQFIGRVGAGMESIDVEYAENKGIHCLNSPEGNRDAVAEHALGMLLALLNHIPRSNTEVAEGLWRREANRGTEISGKNIGIIGYGNMGSAFAQRLKGFDCRILAYDKYKTGYAPSWVEECSMKKLFAECDIVSLHVPLAVDTRKLVDPNWIASFQKPFVLINTARGPVVDSMALADAMEKRKVMGACLDVLEYEESSFESTTVLTGHSPFRKLRDSGKVIFSPHIAGWTHESKFKLADVLAEKILAL